mmetsp:Transcript_59342/g.94228  ORF Transcript_59342/g.94228 Transcript_59342/m.94228 type:complete len:238 (+) Transcript_59342:2742-3455(+)
MIGPPGIVPCNLPAATTLPVKVRDPTAVPINVSSALSLVKSPGWKKFATPTKTAARPTKEWNPATSSGICSISTDSAVTKPTTLAKKKVKKNRTWLPAKAGEANTEIMPRAVAIMPSKLPCLAVVCLFKPRKDPMNINAAVIEIKPIWACACASAAPACTKLENNAVGSKDPARRGTELDGTPKAPTGTPPDERAAVSKVPDAAPTKDFTAEFAQPESTCIRPLASKVPDKGKGTHN